jgi:beta-N-acetylhexosaminidase
MTIAVTTVAAVLALVAAACAPCGPDPMAGRAGADTPATDRAATLNGMSPDPCTPASLEERAARVLVVGLPDVTEIDDPLLPELREIGVGGVLVTHANVRTQLQVQRLIRAIRSDARHPMIVAADEEPGRVRTIEELVGFVPSARRLAAEKTVEEVREQGRTTGRQLSALGVTMNFAPVADLDAGPWDGIIGDRSFSADPVVALNYVMAYARGLQESGVTPVVKHFPGHGRTQTDGHVELPEIRATLTELRSTDLHPFREAVASGAPVVMMGNVAYDALERDIPASLSPPAYRLLRDLGFEGVAMTDSIGMGAVNLRWNYGDAAVKAIGAGADAVLATDGWGARWMRDDLVAAVRDGRIPESRLNEAASRMMALAGGDPEAFACGSAAIPKLR